MTRTNGLKWFVVYLWSLKKIMKILYLEAIYLQALIKRRLLNILK
jgi:hypothetical protein